MGSKVKIFSCNEKALLVKMLSKKGETCGCSGASITELEPNTVDAAKEKHIPAVNQDGNQIEVQIGSVAHPMIEEHYIELIFVETEKGGQYKLLNPKEEPKATFTLTDNDKVIAVYAYCNIHGLWKLEM